MATANVEVVIGAKDEASGKLKQIGNNMTKMSGTFKKAGTVMLAAGVALGAGIFKLADSYTKAGDEVAKMAKRSGWAVESLSELRHVANLSGTDLATFEKGSRKLSMAIVDVAEGGTEYAESLARIGVNAQDLMNLSIEDQFWAVAEALSETEDDTVKTATAMELLGKAGTAILPVLSDGKEGLAAMRQEAHDLGVVFDEEAAAEAEAFQDSLTRLKTSMAGIGAEVAESFVPILGEAVDKLTEGMTAVKNWVDANPSFVTALKAAVVVLIGGGGLLIALSQISRAIIMINTALAIMHGLAGPAGWAKLAAGMAIAGGAIVGMGQIMKSPTPGGVDAIGAPLPPKATGGLFGLASGGIVSRPTVAMVGEAGPEAVIPLSRGGIGDTFNITVMGNVWETGNLVDMLREEFLKIKSKNTTTGF